jgi:hypothetical protein
MLLEEITPLVITQFHDLFGRADNVCEHHGCEYPVEFRPVSSARQEFLDLLENSINITNPWEVIVPRLLDVLCSGNVLGKVTGTPYGCRLITGPIHNQRWNADHREDMPDIAFPGHLQ